MTVEQKTPPLAVRETEALRALDLAHHLPAQSDYGAIARMGGSRIITHAEGCYVFDSKGDARLDAMAGLWCVAAGYGREELVDAAARQMRRLPYYNTFFRTTTEPTVKLAAKLAELLGGGLNHVFFNNSGSEAADTALRMVRRYWALKGAPERSVVISRDAAYHGSTIAGVSLGGVRKMREQGGPLVPGIEHVSQPYWFGEGGDLSPDAFGHACADELERKITDLGAGRVAAFIAEPVQGAGGVVVPPATYWPVVEAVCRRHGVLIISDEVICGFGRLGEWFGHQRFGWRPDVVMMAKGMSSGYAPISAVAVSDEIADTLRDVGGVFAHGFTYSGHPVGAAVALENIRILEDEGLVARVRTETGPYLADRLAALSSHPVVGEVRSVGLLGGIDLARDKDTRERFSPAGRAAEICRDACWEAGLIVRALGEAVAVCPPLIISEPEIDELCAKLRVGLDAVAGELGDG
ncbi:MAG: aminotransferase [Caulobacterales bacterium]|nr:aminotransferase [Caulobacterales bacterium]